MASNSLGALKLDLVVRIGGFTAPLDQAERHAQKTSKSISDAAKSASQAWSGLSGVVTKQFAGVSIGDVFNKFVAETRAAEAEQAQLAAMLRSTGEAAGFTRAELNDMAAAMEGRSIFSTGDINTAQTALLAFTDVAGGHFTTVMQSAMDMAARTGMTVAQAAETIGQALHVPAQGLGELSKQGVLFTSEQQELVRQFEATGKMAEAQGIILDALSGTYGGAAQAARDTFGGALIALQNTIDGLLTGQDGSLESARLGVETLNAALSDPATKAGVAVITEAMTDMASKAIESIPFIIDAGDGVVRVFDVLGNTLVGMYATAAARIQSLVADSATALSYLPDFAGGAEFAQRAAQYRADATLNLKIAEQAAAAIRENLDKPLKGSAMADLAKQAEQARRALGESGAVHDGARSSAGVATGSTKAVNQAAAGMPRATASAQPAASARVKAVESESPKTGDDAIVAQVEAEKHIVSDTLQARLDAAIASIIDEARSGISQGLKNVVTGKQGIDEAFATLASELANAAAEPLADIAAEWLVSQAVEMSGLQTLDMENAAFAMSIISDATSGISEGLQNIITGTQSADEAFVSLASRMADSMAGALADMAADWLVYQALEMAGIEALTASKISGIGAASSAQQAAIAVTSSASSAATALTTSTQTAAAATVAAAWSPAALWASIGSFGQAAVLAGGAILAVKALGGFRTGGYTGSGDVGAVAGVVHGQEYVFDAESTARIGVSNLEAMRHGEMALGSQETSAAGVVRVERTVEEVGRSQSVGGITINAPVSVQAQPGMSQQDAQRQGDQMARAFRDGVVDILRREMGQGGVLYRRA